MPKIIRIATFEAQKKLIANHLAKLEGLSEGGIVELLHLWRYIHCHVFRTFIFCSTDEGHGPKYILSISTAIPAHASLRSATTVPRQRERRRGNGQGKRFQKEPQP